MFAAKIKLIFGCSINRENIFIEITFYFRLLATYICQLFILVKLLANIFACSAKKVLLAFVQV